MQWKKKLINKKYNNLKKVVQEQYWSSCCGMGISSANKLESEVREWERYSNI